MHWIYSVNALQSNWGNDYIHMAKGSPSDTGLGEGVKANADTCADIVLSKVNFADPGRGVEMAKFCENP